MSELLELTKELISIPSTKDNVDAQKAVIEACAQKLQSFTLLSYEHNGSPSLLVTNQPKGVTDFRIILNAHLDVVPGRDEQFKPYESNGKLFGRGAMDMKAAAAVLVLAFRETATRVAYPLALQLVTDEEVGGFNGTKYQIDRGVRADFVIAGEPTKLDINCNAKGIMWATITTHGSSAHGAYPWNGVNAIEQMTPIMHQIARRYASPAVETWQTTINMAKVETTNNTFNKLPADCKLSLDIRYVPGDNDKVKAFLGRISEGHELELLVEEPAQSTDAHNPYVQKLFSIVEAARKQKPELIRKHGGSDVRHFSQVGCPGVTFGPLGEGMHTDEEYVSIASLEQYYAILKDFLQTTH